MNAFPQNLIFESFMKICRENPKLVQIGQNHRILYIKIQIRFIVAGLYCIAIKALSSMETVSGYYDSREVQTLR